MSHALRILKDRIATQKQHGAASLEVNYLLAVIAEIEKVPEPSPNPAQLAQYEAQLQDILERAKHEMNWQLEAFRAVVAAGQNAIRTSVTINGGASVAILAYLGHLATEAPEQVAGFASCLLPFGIGTLAGGFVSAMTYFAQYAGASKEGWHQKVASGINWAGIAFGLGSYVAFAVGIGMTYQAFTS